MGILYVNRLQASQIFGKICLGNEMEKTKLTLRIEKPLIESAKQYAAEHNTTLSKLVADYLRRVISAGDLTEATPVLHELSGILPADVSVGEYHQHLTEKYGR